MRGIAGTILLAPLALLFSAAGNVEAATVTAASCNAAHVQGALNQAAAGDTVFIPAGTCGWTTSVSRAVPANVTLTGASTSATGGGDQTVIIDNYATNAPLLSISVPTLGTFRMTGITVKGGSGALKHGGLVSISGPGTVRLDHLHLNTQTYSPSQNHPVLMLNGQVYGVLDHSVLDLYSTSAIYMVNGADSGNTDWSQATDFGGSNYFFVEDNIVNGTVATHDTRLYDCYTGGRVVARFNSLTASCAGEDHATGHAWDDRGCRSHEIYGNTQVQGNGQTEPNYVLIDIGSGTALLWGNQSVAAAKNVFHFNVTRKDNSTYSQSAPPASWGYCGTAFSGSGSEWDQNSDSVTGYACIDQPGRGQGDLLTGVFPNKVNQKTGTRAWPQQVLEPIYIWSNSASVAGGWGGSYYSNQTGGRVVANRDYYPQASGVQTSATSPFSGTTGAGWGTLANRPTSCTAGVAYWATDQGSWNTSTSNPYGVQQNGADGVLYKCGPTNNNWQLYYTPYIYPHPLQSGVTGCTQNSQCNDSNVCTTDTCNTTSHTCQFAPVTGCCTVSSQCDDANACTADSCNTTTHTCQHAPVTGCCTTAAQCDDGNACTTDTCNTTTHTCQHASTTGCCTTAAQCADNDTCTTDTCNTADGTCANVKQAGCCTYDTDCDDSNSCTADTCDTSSHTCLHAPIACGDLGRAGDLGPAGDRAGADRGSTAALNSGCGCTVAHRASGGAAGLLLLLALIAIALRRRR